MTHPTSKTCVFGSVNADYVMTLDRLPKPGETLVGESFQIVGGGKGANQAIACARLGGDVSFLGCVGNDAAGNAARDTFERAGIDCARLAISDSEPTGSALIFVDASGANMIGVAAGANGAIRTEQIDAWAGAIRAADQLLVQLEVPMPCVGRALEVAKESETLVVLNPAPAQSLPTEWLPAIDILIPNETEAGIITGREVSDVSTAKEVAMELRLGGVGQVIITLGGDGVVHADSAGATHYAAPKVEVVDTVAAGDTFAGALTAALSHQQPLENAIAFAQQAAGVTVGRRGAVDAIPTLQELST